MVDVLGKKELCIYSQAPPVVVSLIICLLKLLTRKVNNFDKQMIKPHLSYPAGRTPKLSHTHKPTPKLPCWQEQV